MKNTFTTIFAAIALPAMMNAQLKVPAPSPLQTVKQAFALSEIGVEYSRPGMKGRTVFGDLVPYGKIWRTGANAATKIWFGEDVKIEGNAVPQGTYALYTIPEKDHWDILLYKDLALGGNVADYKKENELLRFTVKTAKAGDRTETFTMEFADMTPSAVNVVFRWENTRVAFNVTADIDTKIMKNIESQVINDARPYYQAATYYYENNKDLAKAAEWVDKAVAQNPKAYWVRMLKAKIQAKQGNKKEAVATANEVITLAKEAKNDDYVKMAEKLISENK
jgi:tetratricopeptide (TPR) repeat protein